MTMAEVRQMTLHDVNIMHRYWRRNPPLRVMVACVAKSLGIDFPEPDRKTSAGAPDPKKHFTEREFRALMNATGGRIDGIGQYGG